MKDQHKVIPIPIDNCLICKSRLVEKAEENSILTFCIDGYFYRKFITARCCQYDVIYHHDYFQKNNAKYLYDHQTNFIVVSNQTAFELKLLEWVDLNIYRNNISFSGFAEAYSDFHRSKKSFDIVRFIYVY